MDIVRGGELEATNYFFSIGDKEDVPTLLCRASARARQCKRRELVPGSDRVDAVLQGPLAPRFTLGLRPGLFVADEVGVDVFGD